MQQHVIANDKKNKKNKDNIVGHLYSHYDKAIWLKITVMFRLLKGLLTKKFLAISCELIFA